MAFLTLQMRSEVLNKAVGVNVVLNQQAKPPYPTIYLLHGLSDDYTQWTRATSIERYANQYPFLIVMPDGDRSFYCDTPVAKYETFIGRELPAFIDKLFPTRKQSKFRAAAGLSMGGYGALKLGLKYPNTFGVTASHSSAFGFAHENNEKRGWIPEMPGLAEILNVPGNDVFALAEKCPKSKLPKIYFDCGKKDHQFRPNEKLHAHLSKLKIKHAYRTFPGDHSWAYWDEHIQDSLRFIAEAMNV